MTIHYSDIAGDIKTKLLRVPGIGMVYDFELQARTIGDFISRFKAASGEICGWEITRRAVTERRAGAVFRHHFMVLQGYKAYFEATASSKVFQNLADDICALFREAVSEATTTWEYRNGDNPEQTTAQVELLDDRMFGSVLCHHAVISISVTERIV